VALLVLVVCKESIEKTIERATPYELFEYTTDRSQLVVLSGERWCLDELQKAASE
jgi:hypothetical protein